MRREWIKWLFIVVLSLCALTMVCIFSYRSDEMICRRVNVIINDSATLRFVSVADIHRVIKEKDMDPVGISMQLVKPDVYEKMLASLPRIKQVECYKSPDATFNVEIMQREPILRIVNSGKGYYIDSDGSVMPLSNSFAAYVPVATGAVTESFAKNELYRFALFLKENPFWNAQIEQINVDYDEEVDLVPRVGDHIIKLGTIDNFEYKLNKLLSVYQQGFKETGWNKYRTINLSYDDQVVCTKR